MNYITVAEANAIIEAMIPSHEAERITWTNTSAEDKEIYLTRAMQKIEALPIIGRAAVDNQPNQFPRYGQTEVPEEVKAALALEAAAMIEHHVEAETRRRLQAQGVKSFSVGSLSETYDNMSAQTGLLSGVAYYLLLRYMAGVVDCV